MFVFTFSPKSTPSTWLALHRLASSPGGCEPKDVSAGLFSLLIFSYIQPSLNLLSIDRAIARHSVLKASFVIHIEKMFIYEIWKLWIFIND